ncbi:MAG: Uma2 family endonuclease [candidate division KSB1 bacterium]|nr:Uma2 family endonuclease [candidate division KSB1 bacterium]MDZ7365625.1 Uma2 family endonuclease [candidate division KSB1 bacterium]MDZ7403299.1 Uma2 family endonuclease [candidate division KSB1 bacterium]
MSGVITKDQDLETLPLSFDNEEAFEAWCDEDIRAEYLSGKVIMHSPAGTVHEKSVHWLSTLLELFIARDELGELFGSNTQLRLSTGRRRLADLSFVTKDRLNIVYPTYIDGAPDIVIEFVCEESTVRDWREKYWEYETAGVKEYWVIDQRLERMDLYILGEDKKYIAAQEQAGKLLSKVLPGFWLRPEWFWQQPLPNVRAIAGEIEIM